MAVTTKPTYNHLKAVRMDNNPVASVDNGRVQARGTDNSADDGVSCDLTGVMDSGMNVNENGKNSTPGINIPIDEQPGVNGDPSHTDGLDGIGTSGGTGDHQHINEDNSKEGGVNNNNVPSEGDKTVESGTTQTDSQTGDESIVKQSKKGTERASTDSAGVGNKDKAATITSGKENSGSIKKTARRCTPRKYKSSEPTD